MEKSSSNGSSLFTNFIRANPKSDFFSVKCFHHAEFWCADAINVANRFSCALGVSISAKSDLSTGNSVHASYLLQSGDMKLLFTAPYPPSISKNNSETATIPNFSVADHRAFTSSHGLAVRALAIEVDDAFSDFAIAVSRGAIPVQSPVPLDGGSVVFAELQLYDGGDVVLRLISYHNNDNDNDNDNNKTENIKRCHKNYFLPGFELVKADHEIRDSGLRMLDHALINVPMLEPVVQYLKQFTGFHEFVEYVADDLGSEESGLNAVVLANSHENVLMVFAEPVHGTEKKSLTQNFLENNEGGGVHHLALATEDIFKTLREMTRRNGGGGGGGFEFMSPPPPTYYRNLKKRIGGDVLSDEQIQECEELGILVDRDEEGILLQIFTKPVGDRPTFLLEIIQRMGCMEKDKNGNDYHQKGGCGGLGKGNFYALLKSIQDYEAILLANPH